MFVAWNLWPYSLLTVLLQNTIPNSEHRQVALVTWLISDQAGFWIVTAWVLSASWLQLLHCANEMILKANPLFTALANLPPERVSASVCLCHISRNNMMTLLVYLNLAKDISFFCDYSITKKEKKTWSYEIYQDILIKDIIWSQRRRRKSRVLNKERKTFYSIKRWKRTSGKIRYYLEEKDKWEAAEK